MTASNPPRLATALMRWMGPRDEALNGDLLEAYRTGRSGWWYWRQVLAAIAIGTTTAARLHPFLTFRAIAVGWLVAVLYLNYVAESVLVAARTAVNFSEFLFVTGLTDWFWVRGIDAPAIVVSVVPAFVTAWVGFFASGWLVGRLHRAHGPGMVLMYCATLPLPTVVAIAERLIAVGVWTGTPLVMLLPFFALAVYFPALVGGLWAVRRRSWPSTKTEKGDLVGD